MSYTYDQYLSDKNADSPSRESALLVRLYEAGRYHQANAVFDKKSEGEIARSRLLDDIRLEEDYILQCQLAWLSAPAEEKDRLHRLYLEAKTEGTPRIARLTSQLKAISPNEKKPKPGCLIMAGGLGLVLLLLALIWG